MPGQVAGGTTLNPSQIRQIHYMPDHHINMQFKSAIFNLTLCFNENCVACGFHTNSFLQNFGTLCLPNFMTQGCKNLKEIASFWHGTSTRIYNICYVQAAELVWELFERYLNAPLTHSCNSVVTQFNSLL
jgi:hypothetical protein